MSKKLTHRFIKEQFEKEGYELLSKEYVNAHQKLDYICSNRHKCSINWNNWKNGKRCPYCYGNAKPCIEFIGSEFEKESYTLLTKGYKNNRQKLEFICPEGHTYNISWDKWVYGGRCPYCSGHIKPTIKLIKSEFEKEGHTLLTTKYIDSQSKLNYICSKGHAGSITWNTFQQGGRCFMCAVISRSGSNSSAWKGGISCEPYCDAWADKEYKKSILERDNHQCQNPDCWGTSERLTIHHIDYVKKHCDPWNLITLCNSCNARANKSRECWTKFYRGILEKKSIAVDQGVKEYV